MLPPSVAFQASGGACVSLGSGTHTSPPAALPLPRIGVSIAFGGGSPCTLHANRSVSFEFECGDDGDASPARVDEVATCVYVVRARSPGVCPAACARDEALGGAVCGGAGRGHCERDSVSSELRCVCEGGASGAACADGGSASSTPRATLAALRRVAVLLSLLFCVDWVRGGSERRRRGLICALALLQAAAGFGAVLTVVLGGAGAALEHPHALASVCERASAAALAAEAAAAGAAAAAPLMTAAAAATAGVSDEALAAAAARFQEIYVRDLWSADPTKGGLEGGGSGKGSSFEQTPVTRLVIEMLVYRYAVTTLLDAPCGSTHWWPPLLRSIRERVPCFFYAGVDVAPLAIARARALHAGDAATVFDVADIATAALPARADLVLCRDALQHLPLGHAARVLRNFARANATRLLLGSYSGAHENRNIGVGDYYPINLLEAPFLLPPPVADYDERTHAAGEHDKHLLLYEGAALGAVDWEALVARADAMK